MSSPPAQSITNIHQSTSSQKVDGEISPPDSNRISSYAGIGLSLARRDIQVGSSRSQCAGHAPASTRGYREGLDQAVAAQSVGVLLGDEIGVTTADTAGAAIPGSALAEQRVLPDPTGSADYFPTRGAAIPLGFVCAPPLTACSIFHLTYSGAGEPALSRAGSQCTTHQLRHRRLAGSTDILATRRSTPFHAHKPSCAADWKHFSWKAPSSPAAIARDRHPMH